MKFDTLSDFLLNEKLIRIPPKNLSEIKDYVIKAYDRIHYKMSSEEKYADKNRRYIFPDYESSFLITLDQTGLKYKKDLLINIGFLYNPKAKAIAQYFSDINTVIINVVFSLKTILIDALEHEIIHAIQFRGFRDSSERFHVVPKKKLRDSPDIIPLPDTPHLKRDIEYYPILNTIYHIIKSKLPQNPSNADILFQMRNNTRLLSLKQMSPLKWKHAVKLLYSALKSDIVDNGQSL